MKNDVVHENTVDEYSGNVIRRTDNGPKEDDIFMLSQQVSRPLTEEEIQDQKAVAEVATPVYGRDISPDEG